MSDIAALVADNLDIWSSAIEHKSSSGRGSSKKSNLYGIERLRALILDLAVRGKLVEQKLEDEPVSPLLERIADQKAAMVAEGALRKPKPLAPIAPDERPFAIPKSWEWVRLGDVCLKITDGTHHSPQNLETGEYKYISAKNIKPWGIDQSDMTYVSSKDHNEIFARCDPALGDILYIKDGATTGIGTINSIAEPFSMLSSVALLKPSVGTFNEYLLKCMTAPVFYKQMRAKMTGVAITRVTLKKLENAVIPLPPLAEQKRIVAKVDELMALCDALERESEDALDAHQTLVETLLATLVNSTDAADLAKNWARLEEHFGTLFTTESSIDALKQTILDLAVRGKLVEQTAAAEQPEDWAKSDHFLAVADSEKFVLIPDTWRWYRLGAITTKIGSGSTPRGGKNAYVEEGVPFLRSQNVWNDGLRVEDVALIPYETHERMHSTKVKPKDLLYNITGASIGRVAIVPEDFETANVSQHVSIIRPQRPEWRHYLHIALTSGALQERMMDDQVGMSREGLSKKKLEQFPIPAPPLSEQKRIVAKVDELIALCIALKSQLSDAAETQRHLADAMVERAAA